MKITRLTLLIVILIFPLPTSLQGQVLAKKEVNLAELVGKPSVEIDKILGKPKRAGALSKRRELPVATEYPLDQFRLYKMDRLNLAIYFYQDTPVVFQVGFHPHEKPESVATALSLIGIDIEGRSLTEDQVNPTAYSSPIKQRIQSWEGKINQVKCRKIEAWITDMEGYQLIKGKQKTRQVDAVWVVLASPK